MVSKFKAWGSRFNFFFLLRNTLYLVLHVEKIVFLSLNHFYSLSKMNWAVCCVSLDGQSTLFHPSMCLVFHQHNDVLIFVFVSYTLKSGSVVFPNSFFCFKSVLATQDPFHISHRTILTIHTKHIAENLIECFSHTHQFRENGHLYHEFFQFMNTSIYLDLQLLSPKFCTFRYRDLA
jgi:hypothetical protein